MYIKYTISPSISSYLQSSIQVTFGCLFLKDQSLPLQLISPIAQTPIAPMPSIKITAALLACTLTPGALASWFPQTAPPPPAEPIVALDPADITNNGNYLIANCHYQKEGDKATGMQTLLRNAGEYIHTNILPDLEKDPPSLAYMTFFKDAASLPKVKWIFNAMISAANVPDGKGGLAQPKFNCVDDLSIPSSNPIMKKWQAWCKTASAVQATGTPDITLCPVFFTLPSNPTNVACPTDATQMALSQNQFGILLHELVHLYGDSPEGQQRLGSETYTVNGVKETYGVTNAIGMPAANSTLNPTVSLHSRNSLCLCLSIGS